MHRQMREKTYWVYILASASGVLYTGITNDLQKRSVQHRQKRVPGFTRTYNVKKLIYFEMFTDVRAAIALEKQIKRWSRAKKVELIERQNPKWLDLAADWFR